MERLQHLLQRMFANPLVRHVGFCLLVALIFLIGILSNARPFRVVAPKGAVAYIFFLLCLYSGRWVFNSAIKPKHWGSFFIWAIIHFSSLTFALVTGITVLSARQQFSVELILLCSLVIAACMLAGFAGSMIRKTIVDQFHELRLREKQKQSELDLLQAQLNPHFLFNTLNNLYSISINRHQHIPSLLLKLSELLRYSIYDTRHSLVSIRDEVSYIKNYIEFEQLRTNDRLDLDMKLDIDEMEEIQIPPLLLIVFVENAFKYAKESIDDKISISVSLTKKDEQLIFYIQNSFSQNQAYNTEKRKSSGLGLENVIKRLNLLYPNSHSLEIKKEGGFFQVCLKLNMTE